MPTDLPARARLAAANGCRERAGLMEELADEVERLRAERDALMRSIVRRIPGGTAWQQEVFGDWFCVTTDSWHETEADAVAAARKAAGLDKEAPNA